MKKLVKISAVLFAIVFVFSCSNNAGGGSGSGGTSGGGNTPSIPSGPEIIEFGTWPQTIKADSVTVDESTAEQKVVGMFTYYKGSDGEWYCKTLENACEDKDFNTYSNGTKVAQKSANSYKWFKVEPIKWRVLSDNYSGKKLIFCESGIYASVCYYDNVTSRFISGDTVYPNNYEHSRIRAWLNGLDFQLYSDTNSDHNDKGFLQTAFTTAEFVKIADTTVDNSAAGTGDSTNSYACSNTTDKIFLLSYTEVTNKSYGFTDVNSHIRKPTDFALANSASKENSNVYTRSFFLRSPICEYDNCVYSVGDAYYGIVVYDSNSVIVPALCIVP